MKALLQTGSSGRVPVPREKRFLINTGWLSGAGTIQANGGNAATFGGGSGGRVAIVLDGSGADFSTWTGTNTAYGGTSPTAVRSGAAGTVYLEAKADNPGAGKVLVDNRNTVKNNTLTPLPAFDTSTEDITATSWETANNARLGLVADTAVKSLTLNTGGSLELRGFTLNVEALTIEGQSMSNGTYTAADSALLTDEVGDGKVIVFSSPGGSLFLVR